MKKSSNICIMILMCLSFTTYAQNRKPMRDRVDAMKIGFITDRLDLTPEEAKSFWPVYNMYSDDLEKLRRDRRDNFINTRNNFDTMTDAELEKVVDNEIIFRQNELDILKKYHPQFKKILPVKKVAILYKSEDDFKKRLLDLLKRRRDDGDRERPMRTR